MTTPYNPHHAARAASMRSPVQPRASRRPSEVTRSFGPVRLSDYVQEFDWWKLYIDPIHHSAALAANPYNPGIYYDNLRGDPSPGYQRSMHELYESILDSNMGVDYPVNAQVYHALHQMAARYMPGAVPGWSRGQPPTEFPLRHDSVSPLLSRERLGGRELLVDMHAYLSGPTPSHVPNPITVMQRANNNDQPILKTNYEEGEAARLVEAAFDRYDREISRARNDTEKLKAIARTVRALQIVHPFTDYNRRVNNHVLLPKMLMENGFPPVVPRNSNQLFQGGFSSRQMANALWEEIRHPHRDRPVAAWGRPADQRQSHHRAPQPMPMPAPTYTSHHADHQGRSSWTGERDHRSSHRGDNPNSSRRSRHNPSTSRRGR